jgi:hypothetical protein
MRDSRIDWRAVRWAPWALLGIAALGWWFYAAPIQLTKRIRTAVEAPLEPGAVSLISSRVDFAQVNARLSGDLHRATQGRLDGESLPHLLLHGWLPQQRRKAVDDAAGDAVGHELAPATGSIRALHTQLYVVRYKDLNRFMAIFWDASQVHQIVLTLRRDGPFHRWRVAGVNQFNTCAYDFDCATVAVPRFPATKPE